MPLHGLPTWGFLTRRFTWQPCREYATLGGMVFALERCARVDARRAAGSLRSRSIAFVHAPLVMSARSFEALACKSKNANPPPIAKDGAAGLSTWMFSVLSPKPQSPVPIRTRPLLRAASSPFVTKRATPGTGNRFSLRWLLWGVLAACTLTALAVLHIWEQQRYVSLGYAVQQLRLERQQLLQQIGPLRAEIAHLERPQRLMRIGKALGFAPPLPEQMRTLALPTLKKTTQHKPTRLK